jgi:hypothetical protein
VTEESRPLSSIVHKWQKSVTGGIIIEHFQKRRIIMDGYTVQTVSTKKLFFSEASLYWWSMKVSTVDEDKSGTKYQIIQQATITTG